MFDPIILNKLVHGDLLSFLFQSIYSVTYRCIKCNHFMLQVPTQQLTATPLPTPTLRQAPLKRTLLPLLAIGRSLLKG